MSVEEVYDVRPGDGLGPFKIGMREEELAAMAGGTLQSVPASKYRPAMVEVRGQAIRVYLTTTSEEGVDEIEAARGHGVQVALCGQALLDEHVDADLFTFLNDTGFAVEESPRDPGLFRGAGWAFWAPEGVIEGVTVERMSFAG